MKPFTAMEFETAQPQNWSICHFGLDCVEIQIITKQLFSLVPPDNYFWNNVKHIHGINTKQNQDAQTFYKIWHQIKPFIKNQIVAANNGFAFDFYGLKQTLEYYEILLPEFTRHCTYKIYGDNLASLCRQYKIHLNHHDALSDTKACAELFIMHLKENNQYGK